MNRFKYFLGKPAISAFLSVLVLAGMATAGSLTPPGSPSGTMFTLSQIFGAIASSFDSSSVVANQNGNLIEHLKYIEDNLGWASSSNNLSYIGSGNVGIGDSTPEANFEVSGTASVSFLTVNGSPVTGIGSDSLDFDEFVDSMTLDANTSVASGGFTLSFLGNIGVGASGPTAHLQVTGNSVGNIFQAYDPSSSRGLRVNSAGRTVIGTTGLNTTIDLNIRNSQNAETGEYIVNDDGGAAAQSTLLVGQEFFGSNYGAFTHFGTGYTTSGLLMADRTALLGSDTNGLVIGTTNASAPFIFTTGGFAAANERMRIDSNGNVGVGTTSPTTKLDVSGSASLSGNFELSGFVSSNLTPTVTNTYSLGTSSLRWSNLFAVNASLSSNLEVNGYASVSALYIGGSVFSPSGASSLSATVEITGNGTALNLLKLTDSSVTNSTALTVNRGNFQIRMATNSANPFSQEQAVVSIASNSFASRIGNPASPVLISTTDPGSTSKVYAAGKYLYATDGSTFRIYETSNPASPVLLGSVAVDLHSDFSVSGKYAYFAGSSYFSIVDISIPSAPVRISRTNLSGIFGLTHGIYVSGRHAYLVGQNRVAIVDVADPYAPVFLGRTPTTDEYNQVEVVGRYAYATQSGGSGEPGLRIFDISNPSAPMQTGALLTQGSVDGLYVTGKYAYLGEAGTSNDHMLVVDISNPAAPSVVATASFAQGFGGGGDVHVAGRYAYFTNGLNGFHILDVSIPTSPRRVGGYNTSQNALRIQVDGRYAFVADNLSGFHIFDIGGTELHALHAGSIDTSGIFVGENADIGNDLWVRNGAVIGGSLLVNRSIGINVASLSDAAASVSADSLLRLTYSRGRLSGDALRLDLAASTSADRFTGNFAKFTTAGTPRFIIESSGAVLASGAAQFGAGGAPSSVSYSRFGSSATSYSSVLTAANDVLISGDFEVDGQTFLDSNASISGNFGPTANDTYDLGSSTFRWRDLYLASGSLHIGTSGDEAVIDYNVNDDYLAFKPDGSTTTLTLFDNGTASASGLLELTAAGASQNLLKLTNNTTGTSIGLTNNDGDFQVRLPSNSFSNERVALSIASASGTVVVGAPMNPTLVASKSSAGAPYYLNGARTAVVHGQRLYTISTTDDALVIWDVANPASPSVMGSFRGAGAPNHMDSPSSVAVAGRYAYVGADAGLNIIDVSNAASPQLVGRIAPDCFNYMTIAGRYLYSLCGVNPYTDFAIYDIANPTQPVKLGSLTSSGAPYFISVPRSIQVVGQYAYITSSIDDSLVIVDISNPSKPQFKSRIGGAGAPNYMDLAWDVEVSGKYAYVVAWNDDAFNIFDISNASNPVLVSSTRGAGSPNYLDVDNEIVLSGEYAIIKSFSDRAITVWNVANPAAPSLVKKMSTDGANLGQGALAVDGRYLYELISGTLHIYDLGGFKTPSLYAGSATIGDLTINRQVSIGTELFVRGGATIGNSLLVNGWTGINVASLSDSVASTSSQALLRLAYGKGYLSGDLLSIAAASSTSADRFTGNYAKFTTAGTPRFIIESSGAVLASGAAQFGAGGAPSSASYSRFGTAPTGHSLANPYDVLLSGVLEVDGQTFFDAGASISGNFEPSTDNAYDLGSSTFRWRDLYLASGSLHIGTSGDEAVIDYNVNDDYLAFKPDGSTTAMVLTDTGNLGIGTLTPGTRIHVVATSSTGSVAGLGVKVGHYGSSQLSDIEGVIVFSPDIYGSASFGQAYSFYTEGPILWDNNSTMPTAGGLFVNTPLNVNTSTITNSYGVLVSGATGTEGAVTNRYALYSGLLSGMSGTATVTNNYGLYIEDPKSGGSGAITNGYGIYVLGASARNYLQGRLGIGTTAPLQELHISSTSDGNLLRLEDSDGTCDLNPEAGGVTETCSSDERLKSDIVDAPSMLAYLADFRIREYTMRSSGDRMTGVIAQELMQVHPELVTSSSTGFLMVRTPSTWQLIKAIQELEGQIASLSSEGPLDIPSGDHNWLGWDFADLFTAIISTFRDVLGIEFEDGGRIRAGELCLDDVCVTKEELRALLDSNVPTPSDDEDAEEPSDPTPDEAGEPTPSPEGDSEPPADETEEPAETPEEEAEVGAEPSEDLAQ